MTMQMHIFEKIRKKLTPTLEFHEA